MRINYWKRIGLCVEQTDVRRDIYQCDLRLPSFPSTLNVSLDAKPVQQELFLVPQYHQALSCLRYFVIALAELLPLRLLRGASRTYAEFAATAYTCHWKQWRKALHSPVRSSPDPFYLSLIPMPHFCRTLSHVSGLFFVRRVSCPQHLQRLSCVHRDLLFSREGALVVLAPTAPNDAAPHRCNA